MRAGAGRKARPGPHPLYPSGKPGISAMLLMGDWS